MKILRKFSVLAFFLTQTLVAEIKLLEVQPNKTAKIYADTAKSRVLKELPGGSELQATKREGMFWQVSVRGVSGWVSIMEVKPKAGQSSTGIASALREEVQKERKEEDPSNTRARSQVMGVRGLDDTDEVSSAGNAKPNLRMVYDMENYLVRDSDISSLGTAVHNEIEMKIKK